MTCTINDDECAGAVGRHFLQGAALCQVHSIALSEIGERAFREWYSNELPALAIEAPSGGETGTGSTNGESAGRAATTPERNPR